MNIQPDFEVDFTSISLTPQYCHLKNFDARLSSLNCYFSLHVVAPPPKPVDIQTFCNHIIWRNPPNTSCEIVSGYDVQFFDQANNQSVIRHADASGTFYSLNSVDKSSFKLESTSVQV